MFSVKLRRLLDSETKIYRVYSTTYARLVALSAIARS